MGVLAATAMADSNLPAGAQAILAALGPSIGSIAPAAGSNFNTFSNEITNLLKQNGIDINAPSPSEDDEGESPDSDDAFGPSNQALGPSLDALFASIFGGKSNPPSPSSSVSAASTGQQVGQSFANAGQNIGESFRNQFGRKLLSTDDA